MPSSVYNIINGFSSHWVKLYSSNCFVAQQQYQYLAKINVNLFLDNVQVINGQKHILQGIGTYE